MTRGCARALLLLAMLWADWLLGPYVWAITVDAPASVAVGQPFVVRVHSTQSLEQARLIWRGREAPLDVKPAAGRNSAMAIIGADVKDAKSGSVEAIAVTALEAGRHVTAERTIALTAKAYPEQRLTVAESMVNPPKAVQERIQAEGRRAKAAAGTLSAARRWELPLLSPLAVTPELQVTSVYGLRRFFNDQPRDPHRGVDFNAALGTPVRAMAAGRVVLAADFYYAGRCVYVDHGQGLVSASLHLSELKVREGQEVSAGEVLGISGKSGRVTGPHLHLSLFALGQSLDPLPLLAQRIPERNP